MPIRLSRSGWNNVIIFSVMGFILLINLTSPQKEDTATEQTDGLHTVIGENNVILTMTIAQHITIERSGQSWRALPDYLSPQAIEQMMRSWHNVQGQSIDITIDRKKQQGIVVSMVFAGQQSIAMFTVYQLPDQVIILNHQTGLYFVLPEPMFKQLIPPTIAKRI